MKNEAAFSEKLSRALRDYGVMIQRIESGSTGLGIPDTYVRTSKKSLWMELKNMYFPVTINLVVPFRPGQYGWLKRHAKLGGISVLAIATPDGFYFYHNDTIQKEYVAPLSASADLFLTRIDARKIVEWLDSLEGGLL